MLGALATGANAQSNLDSVKEITTADAAALLLQPIDPQGQTSLSQSLAENGIDTSEATVVYSESKPMIGEEPTDPFQAGYGPIRVLNCSPAPFQVHTFNSTDTVLWVPFETVPINVGESVTVKCATEACSLKVDAHGPFVSKAGPQVWARGSLYDTNSTFIEKGCDPYK